MSIALHRPMSLAEFLDWEARQDTKYEFDGFQPVAMAGGTRNHAGLQRNLATSLTNRLRAAGGLCRFFGADLQLHSGVDTIRYPDGMVACGPGGGRDRQERAPVVVFEVLSDSTAATDRVLKAREYLATESIQRYVMLEQSRAAVTVYTRSGEAWIATTLLGEDALALPEIGIPAIPLAELYAELDLDEAG